MSYRDETEALRARVQQLEGDLASAEARIDALRGEKLSAGVKSEVRRSAFLGAPVAATFERTLPYVVDARSYEAIATLVRERMKVEVSQVGRTLTTPKDAFSLRVEEGRTVIRMSGDWSGLRGSPVGVGTLTALLGGLPLTGLVLDASNHTGLSPGHVLWAVPLMIGSAVWVSHRNAKRRANETLAHLTGTLEAVLEIAAAHAEKTDPPTRVSIEAATEEEERADAVTREARS